MSFAEIYDRLERGGGRSPLLKRFESLLAPMPAEGLESLARRSAEMTRRHFGRTMRLFAPLYLSNECVNNCEYCGFSRDNPILRMTLSVDQVVREARHLTDRGFRHLLLVAGEHPRFVAGGYLGSCIAALRDFVPTVAIEVGPMEIEEYRGMVTAGAEGLVVYQETYDRESYAEYHTAGPKKRFDWRLECPERGYAGGFRRIGIGALLGLAEWQSEAVKLAAHLEYLQRRCWKAHFTVSLPRLRPAAGAFHPRYSISDREYLQLICALRVCFPHAGIVLSTREPADLRDALFPLGVTSISAGSHTEPGGYTGAGSEDLHRTVRGRRVDLSPCEKAEGGDGATSQFDIADERSAAEVAAKLCSLNLDPVWKDWDAAILSGNDAATMPPNQVEQEYSARQCHAAATSKSSTLRTVSAINSMR